MGATPPPYTTQMAHDSTSHGAAHTSTPILGMMHAGHMDNTELLEGTVGGAPHVPCGHGHAWQA